MGAQRGWLSQIEMRTYSAPARRVWLGPQFTFKTVNDTTDDGGQSVKLVAVDSDDPPPLVATTPTTGKKNKKKNKGNNGGSGTNTPPTLPVALPSTQPVARSQPMQIGGRSVPVVLNTGGASVDSTHTTVTLDVCGSWSDNDYISCEESETRVRKSIADAMHDAQGGCTVGYGIMDVLQ